MQHVLNYCPITSCQIHLNQNNFASADTDLVLDCILHKGKCFVNTIKVVIQAGPIYLLVGRYTHNT